MPSNVLDPLAIALQVGRACDRLGIAYFLGGSLASSMHGEPRATNDIDFVLALSPSQVDALAETLGPEFEVDTEALRDAAVRKRSWNIFHLPTVTKIDLFILRDHPFDKSEFERRSSLEVSPGQTLTLKSPEDSVLRKLLWFQQGGGVSTTQWRDVVEVLRVSGVAMDSAYLKHWAQQLNLTGLLAKAQADAQGETK